MSPEPAASPSPENLRRAHSQASPQTWGWGPATSLNFQNCRKRGELSFRHHSGSAVGDRDRGWVCGKGGNVLSQSQQFPMRQVPLSFIPRIRRAEPTRIPLHPTWGRDQSNIQLETSQVCEATHSPAFVSPACRPSLFLPSAGAPQPHLPTSPLSAKLSLSQDEPRASTSQSVLYLQDPERGLYTPNCFSPTLGKRPEEQFILLASLPQPRPTFAPTPPQVWSILSHLRHSKHLHVTSEETGQRGTEICSRSHSKKEKQPEFGPCSRFPPQPPTPRPPELAGDNSEMVTCGRDIVGPGRSEASPKQPQLIPVAWWCCTLLSPVGVILILLADATAQQIRLRDRQTLARHHTAALTFLNCK